jgi:hypothetical protein
VNAVSTDRRTGDSARLGEIRRELEDRLGELHLELAAWRARPIRIGILGVRGACKTSLLAAWYMFGREGLVRGGGDPCPLEPPLDLRPDEDSMVTLREIARDIQQNGTATATAEARPEIIRFTLQAASERIRLETLDVSGYFLGPLKAGYELKNLAEEARRFIRECDAVLCLVNWNDDALETSNALDVCFRDADARPGFVIGITKFDEKWPIPATAAEHAETIRRCMDANPSLGRLQERIRRVFARDAEGIAATLVAPLGGDFASTDPPHGKYPPLERDDLTPYNLHGPLVHAVEARSRVIEQCEQAIAETREKIADVDAEAARRQEQAESVRLADLRGRVDALVTRFPGLDNYPALEREMLAVAAEAERLGDEALAAQAVDVLHDLSGQYAAVRRRRLKDRLNVLLTETEEGGILRVQGWMQELREIEAEARALSDEDLARGAAGEIRRLTPQWLTARIAATVGGKTAEALLVILVVALALAGTALAVYFIVQMVSPTP